VALDAAADVAPPAAFASALLYSPGLGGPRIEGKVRGANDLAYSRQSDETALHVIDATTGRTVMMLYPASDGTFRDRNTGTVAHMEEDELVLQTPPLPLAQSQVTARSQPDRCPEPGLDKPGMIGERGDPSRAFETYMKLFVNPDDPTPPQVRLYRRLPA
jgi:hypothetical protein